MEPVQREHVLDEIVAQLTAALTRWYNGDLTGYAELFAEEATYFDLMTPSRLEGASALKAHYAPFQGKIRIPRFEVVDPKLQLHHGTGILSYTLKEYATEGPPSRVFHTTEVYRQSGGEWQIVHAHWSTAPNTG